MRVLIVRHAAAEDKKRFAQKGKPDASRPLTTVGRRRMTRAARGLAQVEGGVALIATSPLVRAKQTAELLAEAWRCAIEVWPELSPEGDAVSLLDRVRERRLSKVIALVGHEPQLGRWASWVLSGDSRGFIVLKKGGACAVDFSGPLEPRRGTLRWSLTPRQLRALR